MVIARTVWVGLALLLLIVAACDGGGAADAGSAADAALIRVTPRRHVERPAFATCNSAACDAYLALHAEGNATLSTVCTRTEAAVFQVDGTGTCLGCLFQAGCLHDALGDTGNECDDADGFGDRGTAEECLWTLGCLLGLPPGGGCGAKMPLARTKTAQRGVFAGFCGEDPRCAAPRGSCAALESEGFGELEPKAALKLFTKRSYPSGMANAIAICSRSCEAQCRLGL